MTEHVLGQTGHIREGWGISSVGVWELDPFGTRSRDLYGNLLIIAESESYTKFASLALCAWLLALQLVGICFLWFWGKKKTISQKAGQSPPEGVGGGGLYFSE